MRSSLFGLVFLFSSFGMAAESTAVNRYVDRYCGGSTRTYHICLGEVPGSSEHKYIEVKKNGALEAIARVESVVSVYEESRHFKQYIAFGIVEGLERKYLLNVSVEADQKTGEKTGRFQVLSYQEKVPHEVAIFGAALEKFLPVAQLRE